METVSRLMELYALTDKAVAEFQLKCGLRCPAGCGQCCPSADVQVTVLEMLPIARKMLCDGTADRYLDRLSALSGPGTCILYMSRPEDDAAGHCSYYKWRPVLCRLFGFAAVRGRTGVKALSVCRHIRQHDPRGVAAAMTLADEAPWFVHYSAQVYGLDPVLGNRPVPINSALHQAIERLGLSFSYTRRESWQENTAA